MVSFLYAILGQVKPFLRANDVSKYSVEFIILRSLENNQHHRKHCSVSFHSNGGTVL